MTPTGSHGHDALAESGMPAPNRVADVAQAVVVAPTQVCAAASGASAPLFPLAETDSNEGDASCIDLTPMSVRWSWKTLSGWRDFGAIL